ncbi:MAG: response regulator [Gammaproteobacteria bacterium]
MKEHARGVRVDKSQFKFRPMTWTLLGIFIVLLGVIGLPLVVDLEGGMTHQIIQGAGVTLAVVGLFIGLGMIRRSNTRLARLAQVAETIGEGDYSARSEDEGVDAIGLLGQSINKMGMDIERVISQMAEQKAELERNKLELSENHERLERAFSRQGDFGDFLTAINTVDINSIASRSLDYFMKVGRCQLGVFYIWDNDTGKLLRLSDKGVDRKALSKLVPRDLSGGLPTEALRRREWITVSGIDEEALPTMELGFGPIKITQSVAIPVLFQGKGLGVLIVAAAHQLEEDSKQLLVHASLNNAMAYKLGQQQAIRLEQANRELVEADRLRSEFVANMSHELRTPLNSIIGFSNLLLKNRDDNLSKRDVDFAEKINRNGKHLLGLINDILDLSKIEAGRMDVEIRDTDLGEIVGDVVDMLQTQAQARHIELKSDLPDQPVHLITDGDKLKQVMINLIGNAIKFTHEGSVTLKVRSDEERMKIAVVDTGIGIPQEKLEHIFEPFRQADGSTTRKYGGTGLGLSISRSIIELLGGTLVCRSEEGQGSTFEIDIPLEHQASSEPAQDAVGSVGMDLSSEAPLTLVNKDNQEVKPDLAIPVGDGQRVMVVDDDPDARELLASQIRELGATPIPVESGEAALRIVKEQSPDLITLDLMMPGIDGWETLRRLKSDVETRDIPVVVISIVADKRRAVVLGAVDALSKPVAEEAFQSVLRHHLGEAASANLLIVDDDADARDLLGQYVDTSQNTARFAENGQDALSVMESFTPDLIFLDLMMPIMDGVTFLRMIRSEERFRDIPVVIVTAKQLNVDERRELESRVVTILEKGDHLLGEHLREVLKRAL